MKSKFMILICLVTIFSVMIFCSPVPDDYPNIDGEFVQTRIKFDADHVYKAQDGTDYLDQTVTANATDSWGYSTVFNGYSIEGEDDAPLYGEPASISIIFPKDVPGTYSDEVEITYDWKFFSDTYSYPCDEIHTDCEVEFIIVGRSAEHIWGDFHLKMYQDNFPATEDDKWVVINGKFTSVKDSF